MKCFYTPGLIAFIACAAWVAVGDAYVDSPWAPFAPQHDGRQ